jgi:hypothetical protein
MIHILLGILSLIIGPLLFGIASLLIYLVSMLIAYLLAPVQSDEMKMHKLVDDIVRKHSASDIAS